MRPFRLLQLQWVQVAARAFVRDQIEEDLWSEWFLCPTGALREALTTRYQEFAKMLAASTYAKRSDRELEFGDYMHFAWIGLLDAIDRFDPTRRVPFEAYAAPRIRGAVLDGVEALSEQHSQAAARRRLLAARSSSVCEPEDRQLNTLADLAQATIGLAVGFLLEDTALYLADHPEQQHVDTTYRSTTLRQAALALQEAGKTLDERSRSIVNMHYVQGISLSDIAEQMELTRGRISQLHRAALKQLAMLIDPSHASVDQHY